MTTLRTFQNEIEDIHNREISKQRALALADKEKEQKSSKGRIKEEVNHTAGPALTGANRAEAAGLQEMEERMLVRRHVVFRLGTAATHHIIQFRHYFCLQTQGTMTLLVTKWLLSLLRIMGNMCYALDNSPLTRNCSWGISQTNLLDGLQRLDLSKTSTL